MNTVILHSKSKNDLDLLLEIAKKFGIKAKVLTESEVEDVGLGNAIKEGRTGEFIDTESYLKSLRK
jgi:hypothetical protein